ncbi:MAG: twin-arginine translocation signal domain-containing protein, partial [SAR324 cluster bacterium]|nr:twin-arginine translocation signal domain-containing protein [SAR324 cluster bacterium]
MLNKTATDVNSVKKEVVTRRKFMRGTAVFAGAAAAGTLAAPHIATAATVLKVQAAWGGGIFLENAKSYVDR